MSFRPAQEKAKMTNDLSMPRLLDVLAHIVSVAVDRLLPEKMTLMVFC